MCSKKNCKRHVFDYGLCLPHLKKQWLEDGTLWMEAAKPKKSRKKAVDSVEVTVTDDTAVEEMETR